MVTGPRLRGTLRWANHPHRRSDGATVLFSLQGRTFFDRGD